MSAEDIIPIYKRGWQIETLFKQLKQNFPLRYFFSQSYTEEQISQRNTEALSQPITESVSAIVGCWVLNVRC